MFPKSIIISKKVNLYLLVCYQGNNKIKQEWANITGLPEKQIHSSVDITETSLTILFLLHLLENNFKNIAYWFKIWQAANDYFRKDFELIIDTYQKLNFNFCDTYNFLQKSINFGSFTDFFNISQKYNSFLSGINQ